MLQWVQIKDVPEISDNMITLIFLPCLGRIKTLSYSCLQTCLVVLCFFFKKKKFYSQMSNILEDKIPDTCTACCTIMLPCISAVLIWVPTWLMHCWFTLRFQHHLEQKIRHKGTNRTLWFVQVRQEKHPDRFSHKTWCWQKKKKKKRTPHPANSLQAEFTASISNLLPVGLQSCLKLLGLKSLFQFLHLHLAFQASLINGWKIKDPYYNLKLHVLAPSGKSLSRMSGWSDFY